MNAPVMPQKSDAITFVSRYCDLTERLQDVPPSAKIRGLYLRSIEKVVERAGRIDEYRRLFGIEKWAAMRYYPLGDYLIRLACGGALVASGEDIHEGMFQIGRNNATAVAESLLGRVMLGLLSRDPVKLTQQGLSARRQSVKYGRWELVQHDRTCIEMVYSEEYVWIESNLTGAATGTFEVCGLRPHIETRLVDKYNGSTIVRW